MDGTDTVTLTATVTNDKNAAGVTWSVSGGGALSNTTTSSATYTAPAATSSSQTITVTATSVADTSKTGAATLTVPAAPSITTASTSLMWTVGAANSVTLAGSGGISPYTWTSTGSFPSCLTMTSAGVISGTPTAACAGAYTPTFTLTDSGSPNKLTATKQLTITINPATAITFTGTVPATGTYGVAFSGSAAATGGAGALTYSISAGALPTDLGLSASTGAITGTPSKAADVGTFNFTVTAADAFGDSATHSYQLVISYPAVTITPGASALPLAVTGQTYSQTLTAAGGSGAGFTWTVNGLSNGLSSSSSGGTLTISGPATSAGTVTFTASVKDSANNTAGPYTYTIQVYSPVTIPATIPGTLPGTGTVGLAYSGTVVATGGSGNYTWTVTGLSNGLSSSSSGGTLTISGTPTAAGTVTANVSVKDTTTNVTAGPYAYAITLYSTVTLPAANPATLGPAIVNTAYTGTVVAAGGSGSYTWTVTGLPSGGLNYSTSGGTLTITGTPTATGAISFNASIKDNTTNQTAGPITYSVTAYNAVTLNASSLPAYGTVNSAYSGTVVASGGSGTGYTWTVTGLSDGLTSSSSGATLTISGTPTAAATVTASVTVKDSVGNTAGPTNYTINVYNALSLPSPNPATLGPATVSAAYTGTIVGTGGSGNYSWTVTGLPANGLNYSSSGGTLTISGTPTGTGATSFGVTLKDTTTNATVGPFTYSVTAYNTVTLPAPNPATLGPAMVNAAYTGTIVAAGGSGNYSWTVTGLSNGLTSSSSGATLTISGTPTTATNVSFNVTVKDNSTNATAGPTTYTITVYSALSLPTPNPASLPSTGYTGVAYTGTITASGGSGNYSWQVTGLSDNLTATPSGGVLTISGTPNTATTVTFSAKLTDTTTNANITQSGYTITISNPTPVTLPAPNPSSLPSATVSQSYNGAINASGGVPPYTWSINGTAVGGGGTSLGNGTLTATSTGGNTLSISGTPSTTGTVTLTNVKVTDSLSTNDSKTYTITVNSAGSQVNGQIQYTNSCGTSGSMPPITVTINTTPAQNVTTDNNGNYSFASVPNGSYTITPSITGPSSQFYPATQGVTVNNSNVNSVNFQATLGYNVSGTVNYSGSKTGQVYVILSSNCGQGQFGTSMSTPGSFTIHGVSPGTYTLTAAIDTVASGSPNASDPAGTLSNVTVSSSNLTGQSVTMTDPSAVTFTAGPKIQGISPEDQTAVIPYQPILNSNNQEMATSYTVQWSTSSTFGSIAGSKTLPATGDSTDVWIIPGLSNGQTYYFRAQGTAGAATSPWTVYGGGTPTAVTIGAPSGGNTVSGTVSFSGTATGPLYVAFFDQSTGRAYATHFSNPVSPQSYTVQVPSGSNYFFFGIIDQNNNGAVDTGDITNTHAGGNTSVSITGPTSNENLTLANAGSTVAVLTNHWQQTGTPSGAGYNLILKVRAANKLPVAVQLTSGPHVIAPVDIGPCNDCGTPQFEYDPSIGSTIPTVGDSYAFHVTYSDGTSETLNGTVSAVLNAFATNLSPTTGSSTSTTPTFTWTYPSSPSNYIYQFWISDNNGNTIWEIPSQNSNANGFTNSQIPGASIVWGTDPTDGSNSPSVGSLTLGTSYMWQVEVLDSNGNQAQTSTSYQP